MTVEINGAQVYYEILGETGPTVVLLHGWGCSTELMKPVAEALTQDHRVLIPDFPGHGRSSPPPEPWGVPRYADCVLQLLRQTGFDPCSVVAHSFGCRVAAFLAAEHPDLFDRLVLTGAAGLKNEPSADAQKRSARYQRGKRWAQRLGQVPGLSTLADQLQEKLIQKYGSADYKALSPEMRKTFNLVIGQDLRDYYARIRQSTLLVWGENDTATPLWMGQQMEAMIPDCGLVVFEGAGHFAYLEQLPRFRAILRSFL